MVELMFWYATGCLFFMVGIGLAADLAIYFRNPKATWTYRFRDYFGVNYKSLRTFLMGLFTGMLIVHIFGWVGSDPGIIMSDESDAITQPMDPTPVSP